VEPSTLAAPDPEAVVVDDDDDIDGMIEWGKQRDPFDQEEDIADYGAEDDEDEEDEAEEEEGQPSPVAAQSESGNSASRPTDPTSSEDDPWALISAIESSFQLTGAAVERATVPKLKLNHAALESRPHPAPPALPPPAQHQPPAPSPDVAAAVSSRHQQQKQQQCQQVMPSEQPRAPTADDPGARAQEPVVGVTYFTSILTPKLTVDELQRRVRTTKRLAREIISKRAEAIKRRTKGEHAEPRIAALDHQLSQVEAEQQRANALPHDARASSVLVEAGSIVPKRELLLRLAQLKSVLRRELVVLHEVVKQEESRSATHGIEVEKVAWQERRKGGIVSRGDQALNAQLIVLEKAVVDARNQVKTPGRRGPWHA
jgi:hypothetical protein